VAMSWWHKNLALLRGREGGRDLLPPLPEAPPLLRGVTLLPGPRPSLRVRGEKGRPVTLHSPADPEREAETLARQVSEDDPRPLVVLGLGLGYHLLALLARLPPERPLVVVEQDPVVWQAALSAVNLAPLLNRAETALVVAPEARAVILHLKGLEDRGNGGGWCFWGHPPSLRARNGFYEAVLRGLTTVAAGRRSAPKLGKDRLKILVVNPDYFLVPEVVRGLRRLGHEVEPALFDKRREEGEEILRRLLARVKHFSPDLVFTVNHLGFDREGVLLHTLHRLRIPSVSWYVDSPAIILDLYEGPKSDLSFIFVWDPTYVPQVKARGFNQVHPLPLATDPEVFRPQPQEARRRWRSRVAFVGNSMTGPVDKKVARLPQTPEFAALLKRLWQEYLTEPHRSLAEVLAAAGLEDDPLIRGLDRAARVDLEAAVVFGATRSYRSACVRQLAGFRPVIYGDPGWRDIVGRSHRLRPEVNYYQELPALYGGASLNFNATSLQMKAAVNQRVFDAPAAGGFLLTDFREQAAELFHLGEEMVCYREPGEIPDLVRFYLKHEELRRRITARARARILAEHTYVHRLQQMVAILRRAT